MNYTPAQLIGRYIQLRDLMEAKQKAFDEECKPIQDAMKVLEGAVQQHLLETGADNIKTEFGTAYRTTVMSVKLADRGALLKMLISDALDHEEPFLIAETAVNAAASYFTAALNKEKIKEYLDAKGNAPPGVDITTIHKTNFRRS